MTQVKLMDPHQNHRQTAIMLKNGSKYATWAVVFTTGIGVFIWGNDLAAQYIPQWFPWKPALCMLTGIIFSASAGYLTDIGFGTVLQRVLFTFMAKGHPNVVKWNVGKFFANMQRVEQIGLTLLLIALLAIDVTTSYVIRDPVAERAGSEQLINIDSLREKLQASQDAEISNLNIAAKSKDREIKEKAKSVESGNGKLVSLAKEGNGWASTVLSKKKKAAIKHDEKIKASVEDAIIAKQQTGTEYIQARIREAEAANSAASESNANKQGIASIVYLIFSIGLKLLTIILRIMVVVSFLAYSYDYSPDLNGDGVIDYKDLQAYGEPAHQGNTGSQNGNGQNFRQARQ